MPQLTGHPTDTIIRSADRLRSQANLVHPVLAQAYRRRASELGFETWLRRVVDPSVDRGDLEVAVAEHGSTPTAVAGQLSASQG